MSAPLPGLLAASDLDIPEWLRTAILAQATELDQLRTQVSTLKRVKVWTNEDGKRFVFAEDIAAALGIPTT